MLHIIEHSFLDTIKLVPILLLTYLLMEYIEHKSEDKPQRWIQKAGPFGPVIGAILGVIPQCGFSSAMASLYAGRVVTMGTLVAIFLSTSDEMLPILISEGVHPSAIAQILVLKVAVALVAGLIIDWFLRLKGRVSEERIHELCHQEGCKCEDGMLRSAVRHTLKISFFILLVTLALNTLLHYLGEEALADFVLHRTILGPALTGLLGLIPNCAGSVVITQLYLQGAMGLGTAMAGLLPGCGVGLLVLFRMNKNRAENFKIVGLLYAIGVSVGIALELLA